MAGGSSSSKCHPGRQSTFDNNMISVAESSCVLFIVSDAESFL